MNQVACKSKLHSIVRSSMRPWSGNRMAIGRAVVYYARAAYTLELKVETVSGKYFSCVGE